MHVQSCLSPIKIRLNNQYVSVPCGRCEACQSSLNYKWKLRLEQEALSWPFCVFFTLTYSPECVPTVQRKGDVFYLKDNRGNFKIASIDDIVDKYCHDTAVDESEARRRVDLINSFHTCSIHDFQLFMKRLRKNISDLHNKIFKEDGKKYKRCENSPQVRYYAISEYGPKHLRPHYHGLLFFKSSITATHYQRLISEAWQYGFTNSSFTLGKSLDYVTKYVCCSSSLPPVLNYSAFRTFRTFSKYPAIGSHCFKVADLQTLYDECSPTQVIYSTSKSSFIDFELWRSLKDSVFPRIAGFGQIPSRVRTSLYGAAQEFVRNDLTYKDFLTWLYKPGSPTTAKNYADWLMQDSKYDSPYSALQTPVYRWFLFSSRVCLNAARLGVSIASYVRHIDKFYSNVEKLNLKNQLQFEQDYSKDFGVNGLIGLDRLKILDLLKLPSEMATQNHAQVLESFDIAADEFFAYPPDERLTLFAYLLPENQLDYIFHSSDVKRMVHESKKVRRKNDDENLFNEHY